MRDAVGGSLLLNLVVFFVSIVILFFAGILTYSKAYKVKNRIIETIERNENYVVEVDGKNIIEEEISKELSTVGYKVVSSDDLNARNARCNRDSSRGNCTNLNTSTYYYCVCEQENAASGGKTFEVITYVQFEFPIIGDLLTFPVKGETKILGKSYDY